MATPTPTSTPTLTRPAAAPSTTPVTAARNPRAAAVPSRTQKRRQLAFSVVAKPTGAACNLNCQYCFFLSKELLYHTKRQQMSLETLDGYVQEYLAASPDGEVTMIWQGGEPTLRGLPFYEKLLELCEKYRRPRQRVTHAMQTNATLIDQDWARFLADNDVLVGVSLDGPAELHDTYRVNRGGRGTHNMVVRGWQLLQERGVRCNILCTVHNGNESHPLEVYRYFRDTLGAEFLQFIPIVERVDAAALARVERDGWLGKGNDKTQILYQQKGDAVTSRSTTPERYGRFLNTIFDEWKRRDVGQVFVQDFDAALGALFGQYSVCVHAPQCGNNFALEFNGDVYACDHWVEPDWLVGNIAETDFWSLAHGPMMRRFAAKKNQELPVECRRCPFLRLCNGGCPKDRFVGVHEGSAQNYLCPGYKAFYNHIMPDLLTMAQSLMASQESQRSVNGAGAS